VSVLKEAVQGGTLDVKPVFPILLALRRRKTSAVVLTKLGQMIIKGPAVPKIGVRGIPQRAESSGDEYANLLTSSGIWSIGSDT